jgi:hypothetical protein
MRSTRLLLAVLVATVACASAPGTPLEGAGHRGDSKTLTTADLATATQLNLLDFIVAERPQWLRPANGRQAPVIVYVDDARIGGASTLKDLTLGMITMVRYYDASAAQQKFNSRDRGPVIQVTTR